MSNNKSANKFIEVLMKVLQKIVFLLYIGIVGMGFIQVVFRYLFNAPIFWGEEFIRYLFVWTVFISAAMGIKYKSHVSVDVFTDMLPDSINKIIAKITDIISLIFMIFLVKSGIEILFINMFQPSPAMRIPIGYVYLAIPVGVTLMIIIKIFGTNWGDIE